MADTDAFPNAIGVQECSVQNGLARVSVCLYLQVKKRLLIQADVGFA